MVGSKHIRRLAAIVLAGVFIFGASGCYVGNSTIRFGAAYLDCPLNVDLGPGKIGGGGDTNTDLLWRAAPTAVSVRFAVTSSDSTQPITVYAQYPYDAPYAAPLGVVWDGTRSTGTKSFPLVLSTYVGLAFFLFAQAPIVAHMHWWMMAVDAGGNDVGFVDCEPLPFNPF